MPVTALRSYPCLIVGLLYEGRAAYVKQHVREGDEITLQRRPGNAAEADGTDCFHMRQCVGHIPLARQWVSRSLARGDRHSVRVTGFDTNETDELAAVEIEITLLDDDSPDPGPTARSIISEIGGELRILAMVAAADGRIAPTEKALLAQFADRRAREMEIELHDGEAEHAVRWAGRKAADSLDAANIIGRLAADRPSVLPIMLEECELMAEIDGTVGREERHIVTTLRNLLQHGLKMAKDLKG
jgi:tellurite resistance protein